MKHIGKVVCAIIEKDHSFLLAQRPPGHSFAGEWEFPGGKVKDESLEDAIKREIQEELDVFIEITASLTPVYHEYSEFSLTLIPFKCRVLEGIPRAIEHSGVAWVTAETVQDYELSGADVQVLNEYLSTRRLQ